MYGEAKQTHQGHSNYNMVPRFPLGFGRVLKHKLSPLSCMAHGPFPARGQVDTVPVTRFPGVPLYRPQDSKRIGLFGRNVHI